jgi:hypothetical protein
MGEDALDERWWVGRRSGRAGERDVVSRRTLEASREEVRVPHVECEELGGHGGNGDKTRLDGCP